MVDCLVNLTGLDAVSLPFWRKACIARIGQRQPRFDSTDDRFRLHLRLINDFYSR